jgi:ABC-type bacteriocin/lantibiotic exporter with double-glycine peptidase domain
VDCWAAGRGVGHNCPMGADVILDVPRVLQRTDTDCGRACYRAVIRYWRKRGDLPEVDAFDGVHPLFLEPAFRRSGLRVSSGEMDVDMLRALTRLGRPVVCLVQHGDSGHEGHYVVCRGIARGFAYLMDPLSGFVSEKLDTFSYRWHDTDRSGTVYRGHGVCAWK